MNASSLPCPFSGPGGAGLLPRRAPAKSPCFFFFFNAPLTPYPAPGRKFRPEQSGLTKKPAPAPILSKPRRSATMASLNICVFAKEFPPIPGRRPRSIGFFFVSAVWYRVVPCGPLNWGAWGSPRAPPPLLNEVRLRALIIKSPGNAHRFWGLFRSQCLLLGYGSPSPALFHKAPKAGLSSLHSMRPAETPGYGNNHHHIDCGPPHLPI